MGRLGGVFLAVTVLAAAPLAAQTVEIEGRFWPATLDAQVKVTGGLTGIPPELSTIDLKSDLGLKDENLQEWRLTVFTGPHSRLRLGYLSMSYAADQKLNRTVVFNGQVYTVGTRVLTDLSLDYWRLGWAWMFAGGPTDSAQFGTLLEAKSITTDAHVSAPELAPPVEEKKHFSGTLPSVGLVLDLRPSRVVTLSLEASGVSAGTYGHGIDAEASVRVVPFANLAISAGYRYFDLEAKDDPDFAKIKNTGPYAALALRF